MNQARAETRPAGVERLFEPGGEKWVTLATVSRETRTSGAWRMVVDHFAGADCLFLRGMTDNENPLALSLAGEYRISTCAAGGWLLQSDAPGLPVYWLPQPPVWRRYDAQGHVLSEQAATPTGLAVTVRGIEAGFLPPAGHVLDAVIWRLAADGGLPAELSGLASAETRGYFSWGSHTCYRRPADIYRHLIHGWVYEDRLSWPNRWRICSENDAHAFSVTLRGLEAATGKQLYRLLRRQLLLSVIARQSGDGGWRHGEWTGDMEAHYRLNASALHMLMDDWAESGDATVRAAMDRAAGFLARQRDDMAVGAWFLHDELEHSPAAMDKGPFHWLPGHAFGKSASNMLVLNTQLDVTVALDRYAALTGETAHSGLVASARRATAAVLAARPAEWLYRPMFRAIALTLLPTERARALPLPLRAVKRIAWKWLIPQLHRVKTRWPRLVMPGGFVDRHLGLQSWAFHYLTVNLMDLIRFRRRFDEPAIDPIIDAAVDFTRRSGILERWAELKYERYALGFWAEALYQLCLLRPGDADVRDWLGDACLRLEALDMGLPPSVLGANSEAMAPSDQHPAADPGDARLRIVNLCRGTRREWLLVNASDAPVTGTVPDGGTVEVAPKSWLRAGGGE